MIDSDLYVYWMTAMNPLIEPTVCSAIQALPMISGQRGLDAGCGIGLQALSLAEAVGPTGYVIGVDMSSEFLLHAEEIAKIIKQGGRSKRRKFA